MFQNLEYVLSTDETIKIIRLASSISKILFSFSLIIAVIQAGALSVNYMYLQLVRKTTWFISFLLMFFGFFLLQTTATEVEILKYNIFFVDITIVFIILIIGIFSFITKKQYTLLLGCISYFIIPLIGYKFIDLHILFSISQIVFISFLLVNEKKSINQSKNILIKT
jgi:hypothetical protein